MIEKEFRIGAAKLIASNPVMETYEGKKKKLHVELKLNTDIEQNIRFANMIYNVKEPNHVSLVISACGGEDAVADFNAMVETLECLCIQEQMVKPQVGDGPHPLMPTLDAAASYPVEALGWFTSIVYLAKKVFQCSEALIAHCLLLVLSGASQHIRDIQHVSRIFPLSLYGLCIADSAEGKSPVDKMLTMPIYELQRIHTYNYLETLKKYKKAYKEWKNNDEDGCEPELPLEPLLWCSDFTSEGLLKTFRRSTPSVLICSDEAGAVLGGFSFSKEHRLGTLATFNQLYDGAAGGGSLRAKDDENHRIYDRRVTLSLLFQPVLEAEIFTDKTFITSGFLPRLLMTKPESTQGFRLETVTLNYQEDLSYQRYCAAIRLLLQIEPQYKCYKGPDGQSQIRAQELNPRRLHLSTEASQAWEAFRLEVERLRQPHGQYVDIRSQASKLVDTALRIAGVLHVADRAWALMVKDVAGRPPQDLYLPNQTDGVYHIPDPLGDNDQEVDAKTMQRAIEICRYYLAEARRLAGITDIPALFEKAQKLLCWINAQESDTVLMNHITKSAPREVRHKSDAEPALHMLVEYGYLTPCSISEKTGKPNAWRRLSQITTSI